MKVVLSILAIFLMAPVLLVIAIALGPAAWAIAGIAGTVVVVVWIGRAVAQHWQRRHEVPPLHG